MANSYLFNQANAPALRWADTGSAIRPSGQLQTPRLGSPSGPAYNPAVPFSIPSTATSILKPQTSADFNLLQKTKNPAIASANSGLLSRISDTSAANQNDLAAYTTKLLGLQPGADAALGQENRSIEDVFSGKLAADLAGARTKYADAAHMATNQALAEANAARKSAAIAGGGLGGSSYFNRQAIASGVGTNAKLAADLADRERQDITYVRDAQGRLVGVRNKLATENAANALLPTQARSQITAADIQNLHGVSALDNANNFYGISDNNPNQPFNPANYPVAGPGSSGGSVSAGGVFRPTGGGRSQAPAQSNIASLIAALNQQNGSFRTPAANPRSIYEPDYFNGAYDYSVNGITPAVRSAPAYNEGSNYNPAYQGSEEQFYNNLPGLDYGVPITPDGNGVDYSGYA